MDFIVFGGGSVYILRPLTPAAREWVEDNVGNEETIWFGGGVAVEHRYIDDIVEGARAEGFTVSVH